MAFIPRVVARTADDLLSRRLSHSIDGAHSPDPAATRHASGFHAGAEFPDHSTITPVRRRSIQTRYSSRKVKGLVMHVKHGGVLRSISVLLLLILSALVLGDTGSGRAQTLPGGDWSPAVGAEGDNTYVGFIDEPA